MTAKTDEQERADFEAHITKERGAAALRREPDSDTYWYVEIENQWIGYQAGRAALQSKDREDAERYRWLSAYFLSDDESQDADIISATTREGLDVVIDHARRIEGEAK
ncbi:MAG TPA: hypothetical protein VNS29_03990 [Burkholderiaceae bacterium]|nr:hypothetical protein [Burkholderiaceae bacterium]